MAISSEWQNRFSEADEVDRGALEVFDRKPSPAVVKRRRLLKPKKKPYYQRGRLEKLADQYRPKSDG